MSRIKGTKSSAALIVAVVALVAALGGGAVAGVAVTSLSKKDKKQVRKISKKQAKKLDKKAIKSIPTALFARVDKDGSLKSGSADADADKLSGPGDYEVSWGPDDLSGCAAVATLETGALEQGLIRRSISPTATNKVRIITQSTGGNKVDRGFSIAVFC